MLRVSERERESELGIRSRRMLLWMNGWISVVLLQTYLVPPRPSSPGEPARTQLPGRIPYERYCKLGRGGWKGRVSESEREPSDRTEVGNCREVRTSDLGYCTVL